ncbi:nucleolar protein 9-like [Diadema setosum]|uniref:nucleolar protein 9-like n=1 Tax=Diadema setosum TaxID=31175 RepID=UPI003B3A8115
MGKKPKVSKEHERSATGRVGRLDEHTMGYYRRVSEKIREGFEDDDEKGMFLKNVYAELDSNEIKLSQNQTVSRILEMLLPLSSRHQLTCFLRGMASDLSTSASDRFASHVLQSAMTEALKHIGEEGTGEDLEQIYVKMWEEMTEHLEEIMLDTYASHVLRSLIACFAGIRVAENVSRSKLSRGQQQKDLVSETDVVLATLPENFVGSLDNLTQAISTLDNLHECFTSPTAGPVLEVLLLSLHHRNAEQSQRLARTILKHAGLLTKGDPEDKTESTLPSLMTNPIGSHILEVVVKVANDNLLLKVVERSLRGRLIKVALHGVANFVLQRILERIKKLPIFEDVFDELNEELESVLAVNHLGVIQRLAAGCVCHTSKQVPFLQALMKAFHCSEPKDRQKSCVPLFASMVTYEVYFGDKDQEQESPKPPSIQLQGSLLLQEMLKFTKNGTILNSFLSMAQDNLVSIATQAPGSYLLEAFMTSNIIGEKKKDQFVEKLKGSCFQIACNKHGSRTIEGIFKAASIKSKFVIGEALAEREDHLLSHPFGRFVHRNLSIGHLRTRKQDWKNAQLKHAQKRKLFADITGGSQAKKERITQQGEAGEEAFSREVAQLMGSEVTEIDEDKEVDAENDEISAIFSRLSQRDGKTSVESLAAASSPDRAATDDGKKKRKKKKKEKKQNCSD